jgi:hypothetical protein
MTFRGPLINGPRSLPRPTRFDPPNLLVTTLAVAIAAAPFSNFDLGSPRSAPYPAQNRTHLQPLNFQLIGKDTFFAGPGAAPDFDWPNPRSAIYPNQNRTWLCWAQLLPVGAPPFSQQDWPNPRDKIYPTQTRSWLNPAQIQLVGQDVFFGSAGMGPDFDWPTPKAQVYPQSNRTWVFAQQLVPVGPAPFAQDDWPLPRTRGPGGTWTWSQQLISAPVAAPFSQTDWPNPRASAYPSQTRSWTKIALLPPLNAAAMPFNQSDWPNPRTAYYTGSLRWHSAQLFPDTVVVPPSGDIVASMTFEWDERTAGFVWTARRAGFTMV